MTDKEIKHVEALTKAYTELMCNCVDAIGFPKKPTVKQLEKAGKVLDKFNKAFKEFPHHEN